jgi:hypothetical protein
MARIGRLLGTGLSYLKEAAVQLDDDAGDFSERSGSNLDAVERLQPLFVIDLA